MEYFMKERILLVDDDQNLLDSLSRQLRRNFEVETALSASQGLTALKENPGFSVVVADLNMPGMDGIDFLIEAKAITPDTVRIMLSGSSDFSQSVRAVNEGSVFRFLSKPFPAKKLIEVLDLAAEQYHLNSEISAESKLREDLGQTISTCSYCNRIKDVGESKEGEVQWERFELYLSRKFGFRFSHCVCPDCVKKLYEELEQMRDYVH